MNEAIDKAKVFRDLGYDGSFDLLEAVLEEVGLSRPDKQNIAATKAEAVRQALAERFFIACSRGDCQMAAPEEADGRIVVSATAQEHCGICGGSANARAVDRMVDACLAAGLSRLCVVGGSPNTRVELERLVGGRIELRLVDGAVARGTELARTDLAWADRVALWGATILDHKVSRLYRGPTVIQFARRSIQALAAEVVKSVG